MPAPLPANETERLDALRRYEILDTLREAEFDDLARLAAHICQTPISLITLIDAERQWFKSAVGRGGSETPREIAFCAYTILGSDPLIVPDARKDERFAGNPQVTSSPHIRFYAGVPLITPDAYALGSLCVVDTRPRNLSEERREALVALGRQVARQLEARLTAMRLERELAEHALAEKRLRESEAALRRAHDELEQRVLERTEQLARATRAAEAASRAKSEFLATMGHELRTPLNHIIGYSEMLLEEAEELGQEELRLDLEKIRASGKHLLELVEAVLEITRTERGTAELHLEEVSIAEVLSEAVDAVRDRIEQKGNTLRLAGAAPAGTMRVDREKLRRCLVNLLSNAGKFCEGGENTLSAEWETREGREWVAFRVSDQGIGMTEEQIERAFDPFTQADSSSTRRYGGIGLGLYLTRRFSQLMGGEVTVSSQPGEGATFTLRLPSEGASANTSSSPDA